MFLDSGKKYLLLFFLSFSALCFELVLTRIFSVLMWYHFASLSIGLAMLGLGIGGVVAYFKNNSDEDTVERFLIFYIFAFLIIHTIFFFFHYRSDMLVPFLAYFHQPYFQPFQRGIFYSLSAKLLFGIFVSYTILLIPFILAGYLITHLFRTNYETSHKLYYADMTGAAMSSIILAVILNVVSPMTVLSIIGLLGGLFLIIFFRRKVISAFILFMSLLLIYGSHFTQKDEIAIARGKVANNIIWSKWNPFSRVIVYPLKDEEMINPFGQSNLYRGYVPEQWGILVDDTGYTVACSFPKKDSESDFFRWNLISLPYVIRNSDTLIIGPGGGKDILCALSMGVKKDKITAVELNPLVVRAVNEVLGDSTERLYDKVNTYIHEGRSFLEKHKEKYSVIQATSVYGRIPPASGIFTFTEDNLYTLEAFKTYLQRLQEGGLLSLSRFIYEKTIPRMIVLSKEALRQLGLPNGEKSFFLVRERGLAMLLVKKGEFTLEESKALVSFCNERGFNILYDPYGSYDNFYKDLINGEKSQNIGLPTDDRPFYYYNFSGKEFLKAFISGNDSFEERGITILKIFFFLSLAFVILIFIMPLIKRKHRMKIHFKPLWGVYFTALGVGYIMVEIILIKSFSLFLETPIYSMIFVVGSLLFSSALGALLLQRHTQNIDNCKKLFLVLILLIILIGFAMHYINIFLYLPLFVKIILVVVILGITGFFMGIPFPAALKTLGKSDETLVAWGLAINSSASVIGSFFTLMIVVNIGFEKSLFIAAGIYFIALLCIFGGKQR